MNSATTVEITDEMLRETAKKLLGMNPDPVPKYLLLRDVLNLDSVNPDLRRAREALKSSRWIKILQDSQWEDGTWGRFHTQDTKVKQPIPTTESGIRIALDSGLDKESPILQNSIDFIVDHIDGRAEWRDWPEKHDNPAAWFIVTPYLSAANLALIDNEHPKLGNFRNTWVTIAATAFASGTYDREVEIQTSNRIMNCERKELAAFHNMYSLILLSATRERLRPSLERLILEYVMSKPDGIYYLYDRKLSEMPDVRAKKFWIWLYTQLLLSRFPLWHEYAGSFVAEIWAQRDGQGFWDFDKGIGRKPYTPFPLSESWRGRGNRTIDCSVVVLKLLSRYCEHAIRA